MKNPHLLIEKNKLLQALVNLIKNSCDAIDENLENKNHQIRIRTFKEKGRIGLTISDTGCGVEKDRLKTVFKFGTSSKGSSGFGLYYCKTFIEANNGILAFDSKGKNQGAEVCLEFLMNNRDGASL